MLKLRRPHYLPALLLTLAAFSLLAAGCGLLPGQPNLSAPATPTLVLVTAIPTQARPTQDTSAGTPSNPAVIPSATSGAANPPVVPPTRAPANPTGLPTVAPTGVPPTQVPLPAATAAPTRVPPTPIPPTPVPPSATPGAGTSRVKIFLIALNDNGKSGLRVGCGDSAVSVERQIAPTQAPLTAALNELLSVHTQFYGQSGLYNALYQSNLHVQNVVIVNGLATIHLTGTMALGGVCDEPRFAAQLEQTPLQFSTVRSTDIYINGKPLHSLLGDK